ncbi:MAG: Nif3-like dinuclear metal center hexameric protein, partial [Deltaproteobacteria bacterium]|nr:Nif3-like dinuclear metal center hexameric protein [Deltaproteobacteria bacterium]
MSATVADIIKAMETIAPSNLAEDWDNVGLQVGRQNWQKLSRARLPWQLAPVI